MRTLPDPWVQHGPLGKVDLYFCLLFCICVYTEISKVTTVWRYINLIIAIISTIDLLVCV